MGTTIYGRSDDLIEVEGDVTGEVGCYGTDDRATGALLVVSDGTVLDVKYGVPAKRGAWGIRVLRVGELFDRIESCDDDGADSDSDRVVLRDGVKWVMAAKEWERVR